jgi:hypothetical protein
MLLILLAVLLHPNASPQPGELGVFYFDVLNQSQVWVDLDPQLLEAGPNPIRLNVTIAFPGRELKTSPARATIRAASDSALFPLRVRVPVLRFRLHDGTLVDLTGPGTAYQFSASCEKCWNDTLVADIPFTALQTMAASPLIEVSAMGFELRLTPRNLVALRRLVEAVAQGVTVANH